MIKEPQLDNGVPKTLEQSIKNDPRSIIERSGAFLPEEVVQLEEFIKGLEVMKFVMRDKFNEFIETDEKNRATSRILIAARAWLDNRK
jgi:hypothetical protein